MATTGPCTATNTAVTLTGGTGTCALILTAPATGNYAAAAGETAQITSIVDDDGVDELTSATPTGFTPGESITIAGSSVSTYNHTYVIQSVIDATHLVFVSNTEGTSDTATDLVGTVTAGSGTVPSVYFPVQKHDQLIEFNPNGLPDVTYGAPDIELTGALGATSADVVTENPTGLPVTFSASGSCTAYQDMSDNWWIHITATGNCTVTAASAGTASYNAAPSCGPDLRHLPGCLDH